jgi:hypothetical protein
MLVKGTGERKHMRVLLSWGCIGILLALFAGAGTAEAHICIPGIFWQAPNTAAGTKNNQPNDLPLPDSLATDSDQPDLPSILLSPVGDRLKATTEQNPADALSGLSNDSTPTDDPVVLEPKTAYSPNGKNENGRPETDRFHWWTAVKESLLYTGIMHTFNLTTEAGTRDALNGHWFRNYTRSISELRGWSDSDRFMAPYVGHPIEGSVFGFIERQNDPKYRLVQLGDGRDYWVSMLRSMAFSAVWHTQWKIGPASEASIGNVMLHASPGFITLVDTPTLGFCTMLAEDAADRYLIMGLENRTTNRAIIILARSFLNPGRTFSNLMAFKVPWQRDTRIGLFGANYELRKELVQEFKEEGGEKPFEFVRDAYKPAGVEFKHDYPREAPIELTAFPEYESFLGGGSCIGGGGTGAARVNPKLQVVAEVNGCLIMHQPTYNMSADSLSYSGGLRWTPLASHRISPYLQMKFGGRKVTTETDDLELKKELLKEWNNGEGTLAHYPVRSDWSAEAAVNGPMLSVGGGLDVVITRPFAWRVLNVEYSHTWINNIGSIHPQNGVLIATEAVVRIGTW